MKYMCMIFHDESKLDALSKDEWDALVAEHLAYDEVLRRSGHFVVAEALESAQTAMTVRVRNAKVAVTDGPFAETKEQLAGFFLIEAKDMDEATRVATYIPSARLGSIEVRPIRNLRNPYAQVRNGLQ
jgi:hypothetical protein